jgi:DNA (cytosine-5)-methyltransferase 1
MTFGSLFSGIGGIDLGLERAGMECKWQVEIDPYCQKVLAKHWPHVRRYDDVRSVGADTLEAVDLIAGGFPCQDVSVAGKRAGLKEGTRSGLWFEYHRIICELRPRYVFVENVPGLLIDGMGIVLGDLADAGYNAEWQVLSAADMGAPHLRKRVWIVARDTNSSHVSKEPCFSGTHGSDASGVRGEMAHPSQLQCDVSDYNRAEAVAYPEGKRGGGWDGRGDGSMGDAEKESGERGSTEDGCWKWWPAEPDVGRVAHGVPSRVDRLKSLGNAVVPQCAEYIGRRIMSHDQE